MRRTLLILAVILVSGCSTSIGRYGVSRLNDLTDVAHVDVTPKSYGLMLAVGPAKLGYERAWKSAETACRISLGLGGFQTVELHGSAWGYGWPVRGYDFYGRAWGLPGWADKQVYAGSYRKTSPPFGAIALHLGWPSTIGAQVDFVELGDFVAGLFDVDLLDDDQPPPR